SPNIVFIMADDMGSTQLGCYGSDYYETPNIDRLAARGMKFTQAYSAAPVCSPTRASLMTGKFPAKTHVTDFIKGNDPPEGAPLNHPKWQKHLPLEETTFAEILKQHDYSTAWFGKWHLSIEKNPPISLEHNPDKQGFDEVFVTYKPSNKLGQEWQTPENDGHNVKLLNELSLKFIEKNKNKPFFLGISHNTIHNPLMEKAKLIEKYKQKANSDDPRNNPVFGAMIETLDNHVGDVMDKLDKLGLTDNTVFIFYSDNGNLLKEASNAPFRSGKASLYEGGIRVPLIISWPGKVKAGTETDALVNTYDFFPTFLEIADIKNKPADLDGISLVPFISGKEKIDRNTLYWNYPHYHGNGEGPCSVIREGDYKLIEWYERSLTDKSNPVELFNLKEDISETVDLSKQLPEKTKKLWNKLKKWRNEINAQIPEVIESAQ
ncbi:MAG: sulfatase, partial [Melioribacteraceae bacterium]|nr:sulfatase [Melioribacteraceae bacterium]